MLRRVGVVLLDVLLELGISLAFLGLGALVLYLFGVKPDWQNTDPELFMLIGFAVFLVVFAAVLVAVRLWKRKSGKK